MSFWLWPSTPCKKKVYNEKTLALSLQRGGGNANMSLEKVKAIFAAYGLKPKKK